MLLPSRIKGQKSQLVPGDDVGLEVIKHFPFLTDRAVCICEAH